ncbi:MAG: High-affinity nickel transporter [Pedosphaera sp.]|nr:High-affinity nickel transporter [Pedosphaera sp.]
MLLALTGFVAGFLHVLSGPDHWVAVAPLAVRRHRRAWCHGIRWGFGHSAGLAIVGGIALALREIAPIERFSNISERLVGVMLLGLGWWSLRKALRFQLHVHLHGHDGPDHAHAHFHGPTHAHVETVTQSHAHAHTHAAVGIGTLHGLAGGSHFLGILPALALPTIADSIVYLGCFAAGTVAAMAGFSAILGALAGRAAQRGAAVWQGLMYGCSAMAFGAGAWWLFL